MSRAAILLGAGHPPEQKSGGTVFDVHLHPDCPDRPLSLGEQWGRVSGVGAQFTLQKAVQHCADHLKVCGCEWLIPLAHEEAQSGRLFTPDEILQRRPEAKPETSAVVKVPPPARAVPPGLLEKIRAALAAGDFGEIESLRDALTDDVVEQLVREWSPVLPWQVKDAYVALLQDQQAACVHPVFRDALRSESVESRAYALCVLTGDFGQFTSLLTDGWVDAAKVDAAIARAGLK